MTLFVAALIAVMAAAAVQSRGRAIRDAERATQDTARLLEAQMTYVLDVAATILAVEAALADDADITRDEARADMSRDLKVLIRDKPYVFRAFVADWSGRVIAGSLEPLPWLDVSERPYFRRHLLGEVGPVLTTGIQSQASGEPLMILSRRMDRAGGPAGVIIVSFNLDVLRDVFASLAPSEFGAVFQLISADMEILVDVSPPPDQRGGILSGEDARALIEGRTVRLAGEDGEERIWANRRVGDKPLYVRVGTSMPTVIFGWKEDLAAYGLGGGIAVVALVMLAGFVMVYGRREEAAARALRDLNVALESRVADRTAELERLMAELRVSLAEKDVLFKEIHHRVKNNLQVVASMVRFSSAKVRDPDARTVFAEIARRIRAIGLVHQTIYEQEAAARIALEPYLEKLAESEGDVYGAAERGIAITVSASGDLDLNNAVSVGLIVSELIANSLKHAFPDGRTGSITVDVRGCEGRCGIMVADDGVGMPEGARDGTGLGIIRAVATQLDAVLTITVGAGTRVEMSFPI